MRFSCFCCIFCGNFIAAFLPHKSIVGLASLARFSIFIVCFLSVIFISFSCIALSRES